jgi:hypothetical protein
MHKFLLIIAITFLSNGFVVAQVKGVDPQNRQIQRDANKGTDRGNDVSRSWDFGAGKTRVRGRLDNPQRLNGRRDYITTQIIEVLREQRMIVDESSSRLEEGLIITQPYTFARGAVITRNELTRYAEIPRDSTVWTRGRFVLTIDIQAIDGTSNNISVSAKVEGRSENGLMSEWSVLPSSGAAEEEFLVKLVEMVTGRSPDDF